MDIEKLINKKTVNNEPLFSVYLHSRANAAGVPASGTFELTSRCNFNCKMCYVHNQDSALCRKTERSAEWWINLGKKAAEKGTIFLLLTGGEPLLREDFSEIYTELSKMGFIIAINTNGYLLNDKIFELFKKLPPSRVNISLYGASEETYERVTGVRGFSKVINNIKTLKEIGIDTRINGSFTKDNYMDYQELYNISRDLGVHIKATPYMFPKVLVGGKPGENARRLSAEDAAKNRVDWLKVLYTPEEYMKRTIGSVKGVDSFELSRDEECAEGKVKCRAGKSSFWINAKGEMCFCGVAGFPFSIDELGFDGAWERVREFSAAVRTPAKCESCKLKYLCMVCAAACYTETGSFSEVPEYVCRLTEETFKLMLADTERLGIDNGN